MTLAARYCYGSSEDGLGAHEMTTTVEFMTTQSTAPRGALPQSVETYLNALRACQAMHHAGSHQTGKDFTIEEGRRYYKVVCTEDGRAVSVHAFIEVGTNKLVKAASYKAPQRNSDGSLAVRYDLEDKDVLDALVELLKENPGMCYGSYLYAR